MPEIDKSKVSVRDNHARIFLSPEICVTARMGFFPFEFLISDVWSPETFDVESL